MLGPLEVERGGHRLAVGGARQRAVLAVLVLNLNRVVSRDRLIDAVWGETPPETAARALQVYVSGLRKILGAERIVTRAPGYLLQAEPDSVDLIRFENLVDAGKEALATGDALRASEQLEQALQLWRGEALEDLESAPEAEREGLRLGELRLAAIEERVDAELALGRHAELVGWLQALVREHPFRERLRGQLMLALYRSGRQAEALDHYQEVRRLFAEELGIEPGDPLKRLERLILERDPELGYVPRASNRSAGDGVIPRPRRLHRRRRLLLFAAAAAAATAAAVAIAYSGDAGSPSTTVLPNSVAVVDAKSDRLIGDIAVGGRPVAVAAGQGAIWVADGADSTISRIDPRTRKVVGVRGTGTDLHGLAVGFGSVWTADGTDGTVTRIDAKTDEIVHTFLFGQGPELPVFWIATGAGSVWATRGDTLLRIDPATNRWRAVRIPAPDGLAADSHQVWVATAGQRLLRLSLPTGKRRLTVPLGSDVAQPTIGSGSLWLIVYRGVGQIWRIKPNSVGTSSARTLAYPALSSSTHVPVSPVAIAAGDGAIWVVDLDGTLLKLDASTGHVVAQTTTAPTMRSALAIADGAVWVAIQQPR